MFKAGETIGPYTLIKKLGRGAFGVVWLAERRTTIATTKIALKMPLDDEVDLQGVRQEADLWIKASGHPNVLPIIEANVYEGQVIIASEYAPDGSLEAWLTKNGGAAPHIGAAIEMVLGILAGLEHLHRRNIIHRDLKPANLLLQGQTPRLADFGISRILKSTSQSNFAAGTPVYMAPEAFEGKRNEQTDVWSAGVILYQMLSGTLPFPHGDITSLMGAILTRNPDPLPISVPKSLHAVIERALNKNLWQRYKTANEMMADLRRVMEKPYLFDYQRQTDPIAQKQSTTMFADAAVPGPMPPAQLIGASATAAAVAPTPIHRQYSPISTHKTEVKAVIPRSAYIILTLLALSIVFVGVVILLKPGSEGSPIPSSQISQEPTQAPITITREEIEQMIERWRQSWEHGDLALYSTYYDVSFSGRNYSPQKGYRLMTREEWITDKQQKLRRGQGFSIQLGLRTIGYNNDVAVVSFTQSYRSATYNDYGRKTLHLRKLPTGELKIIKEDFMPEAK